jgi:hypothetical protein
LDAGVLLKRFDPVTGAAPADADIICATTGGINPTCVPTYSDLGEDVDNCPVNMKELKNLDSWECTLGFTSLGVSPEAIKLSLGAADINGTTQIVPRRDLEQTDFSDIWWVGDKANGGAVAVQLKNALSTGGFTLQTTKNGKGQVTVELTGHVSLADQNTMPMVIYSLDPGDATIYSVTQTLTNVSSSNTATTIEDGSAYSTTLSAESGYTMSTVSVYMGGVNITETAYNAGTGVVSIGSVSGNISINASATAD